MNKMEQKTNTGIDRLDDDTITMKTDIVEQLTNQEFYDMWANMKMQLAKNEQMIKQNEDQMVMAKRKNEVLAKRIADMTKTAKDCEARLPSIPATE